MKVRFLAVVMSMLAWSCATTASNPHAYAEMEACPSSMTDEQHQSGVVRCRALCSSYGRDFAEYRADCRCMCMPGAGRANGGYRPQPKAAQRWNGSQTDWTPGQGL